MNYYLETRYSDRFEIYSEKELGLIHKIIDFLKTDYKEAMIERYGSDKYEDGDIYVLDNPNLEGFIDAEDAEDAEKYITLEEYLGRLSEFEDEKRSLSLKEARFLYDFGGIVFGDTKYLTVGDILSSIDHGYIYYRIFNLHNQELECKLIDFIKEKRKIFEEMMKELTTIKKEGIE